LLFILALFFQVSLRIKPILMRSLIFLSIFFFYGISQAQNRPVEVPKIAIKVPLGETVDLGDVSITFEKVVEDSRCPEGVQCVWAGNAKIQVKVSQNDSTSEEMIVLFENGKQPMIFQDEKRSLRAMQLKPYPNSSDKGERAYVLLISEVIPG